MIPTFLRPELLGDASIEIVPAPTLCPYCPTFDPTVNRHGASHVMCARCRAAFHTLLVDPRTGPRLDAMLEDNRQIDRALAVVELEIVPPSADAPKGPVVDVVLEPKKDGGR